MFAVARAGCSIQSKNDIAITPGVIGAENLVFPTDYARAYDVVQTITFKNTGNNQPEKLNLWVALISNFPPYQEVHSMIISPSQFSFTTDEYDNRYAEFDFLDFQPGETLIVDISYDITLYPSQTDMSNCEGEIIQDYTQPELYIEANNPQIISLAENLSIGAETVCQQVRSFYDYIGDNLIYTVNDHSWGAQATFGKMGADCTEYASLLIALSRSQKIPARFLEGILFLENEGENGGKVEHAWLDLYLPGKGWVPMDPTLGRTPLTRGNYFGKVPADHFIVTLGRNPSTLRGGSYFTYIYWPGNATSIDLVDQSWQITPVTP